MTREFVVRVGVNYDDAGRKVFPYGLKWVEIDGKRIDNGLQRVINEHAHNEFGTTTIEIAGYRYEEVDQREVTEPIDWRSMFIKYRDLVGHAEGIDFLKPGDWTTEEWIGIQSLEGHSEL